MPDLASEFRKNTFCTPASKMAFSHNIANKRIHCAQSEGQNMPN